MNEMRKFINIIESYASDSDADRLLRAIRMRDCDMLWSIMDRDVDINMQFPDGNTPLTYAIQRYPSNYRLIKCIIDLGGKVNKPHRKGIYPLHFAIRNSPINVIRLLVNAGADVHQKNPDGQSPIDQARSEGPHTEQAIKLLQYAKSFHSDY